MRFRRQTWRSASEILCKPFQVDELLSQFSLPQIVKCQPLSILVKRDSSSMPVNLGQPILLFESRAVRKLLARNVVLDPLTGRFTENDDTVTIPNDYEGRRTLRPLKC